MVYDDPFKRMRDQDKVSALNDLVTLAEAGSKWYWRILAVVVTIASVVAATFQVLTYFS